MISSFQFSKSVLSINAELKPLLNVVKYQMHCNKEMLEIMTNISRLYSKKMHIFLFTFTQMRPVFGNDKLGGYPNVSSEVPRSDGTHLELRHCGAGFLWNGGWMRGLCGVAGSGATVLIRQPEGNNIIQHHSSLPSGLCQAGPYE